MSGEPDEVRDEWQRGWPPLSYWAKVAIIVALSLAMLLAARRVSNILLLVVISIVVAIGLDPAVRRLERLRLRRGYAVLVIFLGVFLFIVLFAMLIGPPLVHQISQLAHDIPGYVQKLSRRDDAIGRYFREHDVAQSAKDFIATIPSKVAASFDTILGIAGKVGGLLFDIVTVAILTIYFMLSLPSMRKTAALMFTPSRREIGERVLDQSVARIGGYVSGNLTTSVFCAVLAGIALVVFGVPFAIPLAMWAGIADLIPQVGSYLGAAPAVIVAFFQSPVAGIGVLIYFLVYQQFENYFLVPRVMKNAVDLSPAAVIISTLIAGSLLGFAGALLALPIAATIKVVIYDVWLRERVERGDRLVEEHLAEEALEQAEAEAEAEARSEARRNRFARLAGAIKGKPAEPGPDADRDE